MINWWRKFRNLDTVARLKRVEGELELYKKAYHGDMDALLQISMIELGREVESKIMNGAKTEKTVEFSSDLNFVDPKADKLH